MCKFLYVILNCLEISINYTKISYVNERSRDQNSMKKAAATWNLLRFLVNLVYTVYQW